MIDRYPMQPFPTSWYRIAGASEVGYDTPTTVTALGRELVIFRDDAGRPHVVDAYCPHLGAHLGVGGCVQDGLLVCPFHGWQFNGEGDCVAVPYARRPPVGARVRTYPTAEKNGIIAIYWDELGREPTWGLPSIVDFKDTDTWTPYELKTWRIETHVQEIFENTVDSTHQHVLHCATDFPASAAQADGHRFGGMWEAPYEAGPEFDDAIAFNRNDWLGFGLGAIYLKMRIEYAGYTIDRQLFSCFTPIDERSLDFVMAQRTRRLDDMALTDFLHEAITRHTWRSLEEDIPVWNSKIYRGLPGRETANRGEDVARLCEGERSITVLREWARQFYTDDNLCVV